MDASSNSSAGPVGSGSVPFHEPTTQSPERSLSALVAELQDDRLWLLRQLDSGSWPEWRLDLAALERELGQLLDHLADRGGIGEDPH